MDNEIRAFLLGLLSGLSIMMLVVLAHKITNTPNKEEVKVKKEWCLEYCTLKKLSYLKCGEHMKRCE